MTAKEEIIHYLNKCRETIPDFIQVISQASDEDNMDVFIQMLTDARTFYFRMEHHIDNARKGGEK